MTRLAISRGLGPEQTWRSRRVCKSPCGMLETGTCQGDFAHAVGR